ncbi:hypothetical protein [Chromobacterium haemolyticum]|uniref:hypothetical protein n=1 Tax=Chromobacterium haemolyticum TaxID=394935 RepID=UPI000DEFE51E|nr:hypothetical protein [Chromobacterium haemolyticum]
MFENLILKARQGDTLTSSEVEYLFIALNAAMFKRLGRETRISNSGDRIVLSTAKAPSRTLPGDPQQAVALLDKSGIPLDPQQVDIDAYHAWRKPIYQNRRVIDAHLLITAPFAVQQGRDLEPANRVALIDGWGETVVEKIILRQSRFDEEAINHLGQPGAFYTVQDVEEIEQTIQLFLAAYPEFAGCKIVDNDQSRRS